MGATPALRTDNFMPGEVIAGKYVVERIIGLGGVGIVLAARHPELDETVAIKFLLQEMQSRADIVSRFAAEAKATVRIKSEYAARVYDVGVDPDRGPYLVMEYLEGKNLADVLETEAIPLRRAVEFMLEVCEALAVAHSFAIIHRDIKPENLFLSRRSDGSEVMKVLDFGISKAALTGMSDASSLVKTQALMGTPFYMSPEQIRSTANVDQRSDIWSLGVVFYEMLTRRVPFPGETIPEICAQVIEAEAPPLRTYADVPEELQAVIDRCFQKDPAKRFQNVAELAIALLPFGPTRARVFAERASSILEAAGKTSGVKFRFSSAPPPSSDSPHQLGIPGAPLTPRFSSQPTRARASSSIPTSPSPSVTPTLSSHPETFDALARETRHTRRIVIGVGALIIGLGGAAFFFTARRAPAPVPVVAAPIASENSASTKASSERETATATPPPAAVGSVVAISLVAKPSDAKLYLDDALLPSNPLKKTVTRDGSAHSVRAEAVGYATRSIAITFDSDKEVVLALDKSNAPPVRGAIPVAPPPRTEARSTPPAPANVAPPTPAASPPAQPAQPAAKGIHEIEPMKPKKTTIRPVDTSTPW